MMEINKVYHGNNIEVLKTFPDNSIDSVVTDPPYGLGKEPNALEVLQSWITVGYHEVKGKGFMGKEWDSFVPQPNFWKEIYRVLKPGGYVLSFAGTRTYDWMVMAVRLAGFEIRDMVAWVYGSGFPKSLDVSKAIESKLLNGKSNSISLRKTEQDGDGEAYELKGKNNGIMGEDRTYDRKIFDASTDEAKQWNGWGSALKPALEPTVMARKPLEGTVAENVLKYGTGAINIDGCRIDFVNEKDIGNPLRFQTNDGSKQHGVFNSSKDVTSIVGEKGRWPANFIHDGSEEVVELFPESNSGSPSNYDFRPANNDNPTNIVTNIKSGVHFGDSGSAARFFYTAKASQGERNMGLYEFEEERHADRNKDDGVGGDNPRNRSNKAKKNFHPTVKPIDLMQYLVRLVTPPNGICLDPYLGSGTTAVACKLEGFNYIGIERELDYVSIAEARIEECNKDYKTKSEMLKNEEVKEVFDIFDYMEETK